MQLWTIQYWPGVAGTHGERCGAAEATECLIACVETGNLCEFEKYLWHKIVSIGTSYLNIRLSLVRPLELLCSGSKFRISIIRNYKYVISFSKSRMLRTRSHKQVRYVSLFRACYYCKRLFRWVIRVCGCVV